MKKIVYTSLMLVTLLASSCEKLNEGVNVNPNSFTDAPGTLMIGQVGLATVMLNESQAARVAGIFSDHFTGADRQFISFNSYQVTAADFDDVWQKIYVEGLAQARLTQQKASESGNKGLLGVAQILEGMLIGEAAALFGDVPYSQAMNPAEFPHPVYDDQKAVFEKVQKVLSEGIENTSGAVEVKMPMYTGSYSWPEVARTLKARYFLIAKDYANAAKEAALGISGTSKSLLAFHSATIGQQNLFYQFGALQRQGYLTVEKSHLRRLLTGAAPRLLTTPGDTRRAAVYFNGTELNYTTNGQFGIAASFPIVSWEENQLILAEALARTNNTDAARAAFNAVRNSLGLKYGGSFPASQSSGWDLVNEILEEKYCTLIGSLQVFHDLRRTKNAINVPKKSSTAPGIPQRFLYPQSEINTNPNLKGVVELFIPTTVNI